MNRQRAGLRVDCDTAVSAQRENRTKKMRKQVVGQVLNCASALRDCEEANQSANFVPLRA